MSMIILHGLTALLTFIGLVQLAFARQAKRHLRNSKAENSEDNQNKDATSQAQKRWKIGSVINYNKPIDVPEENEAEFKKFQDDFNMTPEDIQRETICNFWLCVVEDLNTILCYAFVVRACDAQSSIHDDSTIFFDVLCIVFLGFLQHVANILMIFHAHIEKHTKIEKEKQSATQQKEMQNQLNELVTFIARTRLLLFFMIGVTVVFFYLRISPTYEQIPIAIPYEILRALALITMVSLNTLHSAWYEFENAASRKTYWDTSPTWKLGALAFIALISCIMLEVNIQKDHKSADTRTALHTLSTPAPSGTPSPSK